MSNNYVQGASIIKACNKFSNTEPFCRNWAYLVCKIPRKTKPDKEQDNSQSLQMGRPGSPRLIRPSLGFKAYRAGRWGRNRRAIYSYIYYTVRNIQLLAVGAPLLEGAPTGRGGLRKNNRLFSPKNWNNDVKTTNNVILVTNESV